MLPSEILMRLIYVLRAIEGRVGLNQISRESLEVLLFIAQAELAGEVLRIDDVETTAGPSGDKEFRRRLATLEREDWISSTVSPDGLGKYVRVTNRARHAIVRTAAELQKRRP